ncbi:MAG: type IV pili twitching motility protein PilT [Armatimonadetes bacterium CG_4_10_14_3_um_filter_66_18]|nr:MAG: type IV pili twitching motility protein PilT [Armatimonadetes bacterium CG06_land_8_20_14_3_00_66_21]PIX45480.1 MAG: type IV pili twitching motility protein PilT [Armatimonadetes bacterium CG_4_8_14_3_um_filter_66_20]PIY38558.1 MAG: type IV pili twitching motility protein PilT [Armatimonadetes bacterium CG_4_10_14_3_um_filter_66_18]PIZ46381.1 MAG: type IV pili twitching motility protein PilT [Armatimonadetes bacterium CG_4_10_14_0_8_um_filter_66_14]PJB63413.1 MAG: type IV pili twitching
MQQSATQPQPQQFGRPQPQAQAAQPKKPQVLSLEDIHLDEILQIVVEKNASDLHMAVGVPPTLRLDGALMATNYERLSPQISQRLIYDILTDEQIQRFENNMELDFSYSLQNLARFRVNAYKDRGTVASAFRLIPQRIPTLSDLGLPKVVVELSTRPRGLVLVTGPTGSGKSTTLASMIHMMNCERSLHIITVEDPIEYLHSHRKSIINQRELGQDTLSFPNALRSCLREDPDVILCGEMRDLDTIAIAITMAETGHLVLATLHTNTAAESIDRMIDVFPSSQQEQIRVQLSNNLVAVLSQQLLPRAGSPGRVAAIEVMIASPAIRNLVREAKAHQINSIIQTSGEMGMQTMDQALAELYKKGLITYDEAMIRAVQQEELKKLMSSPGVG